MTYNAGSRLVTSVEGAVVSTYTFDANGNQTAVNAGGSRTTYAYDYENRMRTAIDPGGARSTIAYWADGMRRFLEVAGTRTTFVWDGSDYLQSRTPSDVTTFSTVDAQILDSETGGSESLLVPDPLGSVVKVLDASGNQVYDAAYWPYGEVRNSTGVNDTSWGYVGTWGYHFDTSRRLYVRARVLNPVTGRWDSVDPSWPGEMAFSYAGSAPSWRSDFEGADVWPLLFGVVEKKQKPKGLPGFGTAGVTSSGRGTTGGVQVGGSGRGTGIQIDRGGGGTAGAIIIIAVTDLMTYCQTGTPGPFTGIGVWIANQFPQPDHLDVAPGTQRNPKECTEEEHQRRKAAVRAACKTKAGKPLVFDCFQYKGKKEYNDCIRKLDKCISARESECKCYFNGCDESHETMIISLEGQRGTPPD